MNRNYLWKIMGFILFVVGCYVLYIAWFEIKSIRLVNHIRQAFVLGSFVYFCLHRCWGMQDFFHTFTHELAHILASIMCGGAPKIFHVTSDNGGLVASTRSNFFVVLAPYILPLWSLAALAVFRALICLKAAQVSLPYASFFIGFFMMHHILSLFYSMRPVQSDLKKYGYVFSYGFGMFANCMIITHIVLWTMHKSLSYGYFIKKMF